MWLWPSARMYGICRGRGAVPRSMGPAHTRRDASPRRIANDPTLTRRCSPIHYVSLTRSLRLSDPQWIEQSIRFFLRMTPCWPSQPEAVDLDGDGEIDYTPPQELMQLGRDIRRDRAPPTRHRTYARPQPPSWRVSTATTRRRSVRGRTTCARHSYDSSCSWSSSSSRWSSSRYAA